MDCEENTHFKKRQRLAGKKRSKIEDTMLSFIQICLTEQLPRTDPPNPIREGCKK